MTIIAPKKQKHFFNPPLIGLVLIFVAMAYWSISFYNQTVNFRHSLNAVEKEMRALKTASASLKNELFVLTDSANLIKLAEENGYLKVNPSYISIASQWSVVSASQ